MLSYIILFPISNLKCKIVGANLLVFKISIPNPFYFWHLLPPRSCPRNEILRQTKNAWLSARTKKYHSSSKKKPPGLWLMPDNFCVYWQTFKTPARNFVFWMMSENLSTKNYVDYPLWFQVGWRDLPDRNKLMKDLEVAVYDKVGAD